MFLQEFTRQYIRNPRMVGAISPSSKYLAQCMVKPIDFKNCRTIVEYGAGTGVFTSEIIQHKNPQTRLLVFETNLTFAGIIDHKFGGIPGVSIINDSAEKVDIELNRLKINEVDYVVSGLPFTSLPREMSGNILGVTREIISSQGSFITFQYSLLKKRLFASYFDQISIDQVWCNVPPAFVLSCCNPPNTALEYGAQSNAC